MGTELWKSELERKCWCYRKNIIYFRNLFIRRKKTKISIIWAFQFSLPLILRFVLTARTTQQCYNITKYMCKYRFCNRAIKQGIFLAEILSKQIKFNPSESILIFCPFFLSYFCFLNVKTCYVGKLQHD